MRLVAILWFAVGTCALVLAADAIVARVTARKRPGTVANARLIPFSALMLVLGIGSIILGLYEA